MRGLFGIVVGVGMLGLIASSAKAATGDDEPDPSLPEHQQSAAVTAERFTRIALTEFRRNPKLLDCTEQSLLGGLLLSAQLGLEIGGPLGQSWLIPFRDTKTGTSEAIWILGYKGIIALAYLVCAPGSLLRRFATGGKMYSVFDLSRGY